MQQPWLRSPWLPFTSTFLSIHVTFSRSFFNTHETLSSWWAYVCWQSKVLSLVAKFRRGSRWPLQCRLGRLSTWQNRSCLLWVHGLEMLTPRREVMTTTPPWYLDEALSKNGRLSIETFLPPITFMLSRALEIWLKTKYMGSQGWYRRS
jgi:hypothetical protein